MHVNYHFSTYYPGPVRDAAKKSDLVIVCLGTGIRMISLNESGLSLDLYRKNSL